MDSAADKSETTRHAVVKALVDIGRKKHKTVLGICHSYLKKHSKVSCSVERTGDDSNCSYTIVHVQHEIVAMLIPFHLIASARSSDCVAESPRKSLQGTHTQSCGAPC